MTNINIAPDTEALFEDFWQALLRGKFGSDEPPTRTEEIAFIKGFLAQGLPMIPLPSATPVSRSDSTEE